MASASRRIPVSQILDADVDKNQQPDDTTERRSTADVVRIVGVSAVFGTVFGFAVEKGRGIL